MTTFYTGYRSVLRGRDADNFIHTYKGEVGVYSNWSLMDTGSKVLAGMPNTEYVLGTYKHARLLEYLFAGGHHIAPINNVGGGTRIEGARFSPLTYRGLPGAAATYGLGHAEDRVNSYSAYSNYKYDGLISAEPLKSDSVGHAVRYSVSYGGASKPNQFQGIEEVLGNVGHAIEDGYDVEYGRNKSLEWRGVPSARAL
jgi:hypothetical protein